MPTTAKFWVSSLSWARLYNEGINKRRVRSPEAPKMTRTQGSLWRSGAGMSSCITMLDCSALIASPPLATGRALDVPAELVAHGRQNLLRVGVFLTRPEAGVERR